MTQPLLTIYRGFLLFLFLFVLLISGIAQQTELPPGISTQDVLERKEELIRQGVPPELIEQYLKDANNPVPSPKTDTGPNASPQATVNDSLERMGTPDDTTQKEQGQSKAESTAPESDPEKAEASDLPAEKADTSVAAAPILPYKPLIFGQEIFTNPDIEFKTARSIVAPEDYIIGPGDRIAITVTGGSRLSEELPVQQDGSIFQQDLGKVYVSGLTYARSRKLITDRLRRILMPNSTIEVVLGQNRRVINVNIVGEVIKPGTYQVEATTTAFNALFLAGGLKEIGSLRNIYIRRNGKTAQILDIYDYLTQGNAPPVFLQNNDFIIVPVQKKVVEVEGSVRRPMKYELKQDENLQSLLHFAGDLSYDALTSSAQVNRVVDGKQELIDFNLGEYLGDNKDFRLDDGDLLRIRSLRKEIRNFVQIEGAVPYPDTYELLPGEKVKDLIMRAGGLLDGVYMEKAYIARFLSPTELRYFPLDLERVMNGLDSASNPPLQFFDKVMIFSEKDFKVKRYIKVSGEVVRPDTLEAGADLNLKALLLMVGGLTADADPRYIELAKIVRRPNKLTSTIADAESDEEEVADSSSPKPKELPGARTITRISTDEGWESDPALDTVMVYDFDEVRVYSKYDFIQRKYLEVAGAVNRPGQVEVVEGMTLQDLLFMVGGFSENAEASYIDLYRRIDIREKGVNANTSDKKAVERISINENWLQDGAADSIELFNYEKVYVYSKRDFVFLGEVAIKGLVNSPGSYELLPNMTLKDLLFLAGGMHLEADYNRIELIRVIEKMGETGEIIPVPIVEKVISTQRNWQEDPDLEKVIINSFDQVFVRKNPDFDLQESVFINGEVTNPGEYNKLHKNEKLSSLVTRAGGVTEVANLKGAFLERPDIGSIAIRLEKAMQRPDSRYDISMLEGDVLVIPPRTDIVKVEGNVMQSGTIIQYEPGKSGFKYYVNLAGGFDSRTKKKLSTVRYPDGRVRRASSFLFFRTYPKIEQGCNITVPRKPEKKQSSENRDRNKLEFQEVIAGLTAVLTLYLLISQVSN